MTDRVRTNAGTANMARTVTTPVMFDGAVATEPGAYPLAPTVPSVNQLTPSFDPSTTTVLVRVVPVAAVTSTLTNNAAKSLVSTAAPVVLAVSALDDLTTTSSPRVWIALAPRWNPMAYSTSR